MGHKSACFALFFVVFYSSLYKKVWLFPFKNSLIYGLIIGEGYSYQMVNDWKILKIWKFPNSNITIEFLARKHKITLSFICLSLFAATEIIFCLFKGTSMDNDEGGSPEGGHGL